MYSAKNAKLVEEYRSGYIPTGIEYERYVTNELTNLGYKSWVTQASGDFGTDVILEVNKHFKIIFQCKYYSSRIGNQAVQEISAAREYYGAQMCVVVTNQDFIPWLLR